MADETNEPIDRETLEQRALEALAILRARVAARRAELGGPATWPDSAVRTVIETRRTS